VFRHLDLVPSRLLYIPKRADLVRRRLLTRFHLLGSISALKLNFNHPCRSFCSVAALMPRKDHRLSEYFVVGNGDKPGGLR
jgi:hypothetical protein